MEQDKKSGRYGRVITQLETLLAKPGNPLSRMATVAAVLSHKFEYFFWCGFYFVEDENTMIVGPYQGPVACQVLRNTGVCIAAMRDRKSVVVPDVHQFPGHIACDSRSNSEIVIPVFNHEGGITAVLDIDSTQFDAFDDTDRQHLEQIVALIYKPV